MELKYELITKANLNLAVSIQHTIFPNRCALFHYQEAIQEEGDSKYYIIYQKETPVGIIGLYCDDEIDTESIWLGWYGILPEFRGKGMGMQSILDMIQEAKKSDKKWLRLYTHDIENKEACKIYDKIMTIKEKYQNPSDTNYNGHCYIYSCSLTKEKVSLWNSRLIYLKQDEQEENKGNEEWKEKQRILIVVTSNQNPIEEVPYATTLRQQGFLVTMTKANCERINEKQYTRIIYR